MEARPHITLEVTFQDNVDGEDICLKGYFIFEVENHTIIVRETSLPSKTKEFEEDDGLRGFKICTNVEGNEGVTKCLLCPCLLPKAPQTQQDLLDRKEQDARTIQCPCCIYGDLSKHSEYKDFQEQMACSSLPSETAQSQKDPRSPCQCDTIKRDPTKLPENIDKLLKETYELELELEKTCKEPSVPMEQIFQEAPKSKCPCGCAHADVEKLPEQIDRLPQPTYAAPKSKCPCGCAQTDVAKLPEQIDRLPQPTYAAPKSKCPCCAHADAAKLPEQIDRLPEPTVAAPRSKCPCGGCARAVTSELPEQIDKLPEQTFIVPPGEKSYKQPTAPPADILQEDPNQVVCLCPECTQIVQGASPRKTYPDDAQSKERLQPRVPIISTSLEEQTFLGPNKSPTPEQSQQTPKKQQSEELVLNKQQSKQQISGKQPSQQQTSVKQKSKQQIPGKQPSQHQTAVKQQSKQQIPGKQPSQQQTPVKQQSQYQTAGKQQLQQQIRKKPQSQQQTPRKQQPQHQTPVKQQSKQQIPGKQPSQQQTSVKQKSKQQIPGKQPSQHQTAVKQQSKQQIPGKQPSQQQTAVKQQSKQQIPRKQQSQQQALGKQQSKHQIPEKQPSLYQTPVKQQSRQQIPRKQQSQQQGLGKQQSKQQIPEKQPSQHQTPVKQQSRQQIPRKQQSQQQTPRKHQFIASPTQIESPLIDAQSQEIFTTPQQTVQPIPRYVQTPLHTPPETPQEADRAFIASPTQIESPQTGSRFQTLESVLSTSAEEEQPSLEINRDPVTTSTPRQVTQPSIGREPQQTPLRPPPETPQEADRAFIASPTQIESPQTGASRPNCVCIECSYGREVRPVKKVNFADSEYNEPPSQLAEHHLDLHDINLSRPEQSIEALEPISPPTDRREEAGPSKQTPRDQDIRVSPQAETPPSAERGFTASSNQVESPQYAEFDDLYTPTEFTKPLASSTPKRLSLQTDEDELGPIQEIPELPGTSNQVDQREPQGAVDRNEQFQDLLLYDLIKEVYDLHRLNQQSATEESKQGSFHEESEVGPLKALKELENQRMNELHTHAEKLYSTKYKKEELDSFKNVLEKSKTDSRIGSNIDHFLDDSNFHKNVNKRRDLQDKRSDEQRAGKSPSENVGAGFPRNNSETSRRKSSWIRRSSDFLRDSANSLKLKLGFHTSDNTARNEVNRRTRLDFVSQTSDSTFTSGFLMYIHNLFHELFIFIFHL